MTYTITITDPGAEPVTVSLEWTTITPTQIGHYWMRRKGMRFSEFVFRHGGPITDEPDTKWLGPIPLPPSGEDEKKTARFDVQGHTGSMESSDGGKAWAATEDATPGGE